MLYYNRGEIEFPTGGFVRELIDHFAMYSQKFMRKALISY